MPAKVIATVHQLSKACMKYKGIVFTDRHSNIINDTLTSDENEDTQMTQVKMQVTSQECTTMKFTTTTTSQECTT